MGFGIGAMEQELRRPTPPVVDLAPTGVVHGVAFASRKDEDKVHVSEGNAPGERAYGVFDGHGAFRGADELSRFGG